LKKGQWENCKFFSCHSYQIICHWHHCAWLQILW
jgi:Zn-finger protein